MVNKSNFQGIMGDQFFQQAQGRCQHVARKTTIILVRSCSTMEVAENAGRGESQQPMSFRIRLWQRLLLVEDENSWPALSSTCCSCCCFCRHYFDNCRTTLEAPWTQSLEVLVRALSSSSSSPPDFMILVVGNCIRMIALQVAVKVCAILAWEHMR